MDEQRQVLGHLPLLDRANTSRLQLLGPLHQLVVAVQLAPAKGKERKLLSSNLTTIPVKGQLSTWTEHTLVSDLLLTAH